MRPSAFDLTHIVNNLAAYCTQVTRHPTKDQFQELVARIQRIPGCEGCQTRKLRAYFKERRKTEARAQLAAEHKARSHSKSGMFVVPVGYARQEELTRTAVVGAMGVSPKPSPSSPLLLLPSPMFSSRCRNHPTLTYSETPSHPATRVSRQRL